MDFNLIGRSPKIAFQQCSAITAQHIYLEMIMMSNEYLGIHLMRFFLVCLWTILTNFVHIHDDDAQ